ncbi:MAG: hypothetical protein LBB47_04340, partial [Spirochaetaceae bacterium]|nr:hypothetical protein [Spirochaetaceae bacterium]
TLLVYVWRKNDAGYCFETKVINEIFANDPPILTLSHSDKLAGSQQNENSQVFDYYDSRVSDEIENEPEGYDYRHIEDTIDWNKQSKTEYEGN